MNYGTVEKAFLSLTIREKVLILIGVSVVLLFIGFISFIEPVVKQKNDARLLNKQRNIELVRFDQQISDLEIALKNDPNKPLMERRAEIETSLEALDEKLKSQTFDLIPPQEMSQVLEQVLANIGNLKLIEVASIPPETVVQTSTQGGEQINLYQHGVKLVLEGEFFAVQTYLEQIEQLEWQFYWRKFDYKVEEYPKAMVEIDLYTLSTSQAFIGV
jgi:MSHA biogenesis protein MshJ